MKKKAITPATEAKRGAGIFVGNGVGPPPGASGRESEVVCPAVMVTVASAGAYPASYRRMVWVPAGMAEIVAGVIRPERLPSMDICAPGGLVLKASFPVSIDGAGVTLPDPSSMSADTVIVCPSERETVFW